MTNPGPRIPGWHLKPIGKYGLPGTINVGERVVTVGRDSTNDCVVHGERWGMVSRMHVRLEIDGENLVVHDLGSSNGTFVNGVQVDSAYVSPADVLQLGPEGPRFVVFHDAGTGATSVGEVRAVAKAFMGTGPLSLGQTALISLKRALGMEEEEAKVRRVEGRQKRHVVIGAALLGAIAVAGVTSLSRVERESTAKIEDVADQSEMRVADLRRASARRSALLEQRTAKLQNANDALAARLESSLLLMGGELEERIAESYVARESWEAERDGLESQRQAILTRISQLEGSSDDSRGEVEQLSQRLETTTASLAQYSPRELEAEKVALVKHVREAVVMIETRVVFREQESQRLLHLSLNARGASEVNLRDEGTVLDQKSSGSGFVISPEGYILTNAHVAVPTEFRDQMDVGDSNHVLPEVELEVVFSGTSRRIPAHLVQLDDEEDHDFAVIKIEPFEGMPSLQLEDIDAPPPAAGTEVYLCGFPLGTFAVQEGDRVIASTLKGILSRRVGPYVQIDAGVHPGISGGPVTDVNGKVIGVVCSVQATPKGEIAATIGYALPISSARLVLPAEAVK